jgi:hypothetical protein
MPLKIKVPISDNRINGGKRAAISLSDLYFIFGNPHDAGVKSQIRKRVEYSDSGALVTFISTNPYEQPALDKWAAQIGKYDEDVIRGKVNAAAVEDEARASFDEDYERRIYKMPDVVQSKE